MVVIIYQTNQLSVPQNAAASVAYQMAAPRTSDVLTM